VTAADAGLRVGAAGGVEAFQRLAALGALQVEAQSDLGREERGEGAEAAEEKAAGAGGPGARVVARAAPQQVPTEQRQGGGEQARGGPRRVEQAVPTPGTAVHRDQGRFQQRQRGDREQQPGQPAQPEMQPAGSRRGTMAVHRR